MVARVYAMLAGIAVFAFLPLSDQLLPGLAGQERWFSYSLFCLFLCGCLFARGLYLHCLLAFGAGLLYAAIHATHLYERLPWHEHEGELFELSGTVLGLPRTEFRYGKPVQRFDVLVHSTSWPISTRPIRKLRLSWYEGKPVAAGQRWQLRVAVKRPRGFANPGSFDYQHYLHSQRIDATGTVRWGERCADSTTLWSDTMLGWRGQLANRLTLITEPMQQQRLFKALALGDGKALTANDWNLLSRTGTTHLFVVSGLHIGMVAAISYLLLLPAARLAVVFLHALSAQRIAALGSLLCAGVFAGLAGFGLPTQRALLMLGVALLARHFFMPVRFSYVLALAALVILLSQPLSIRSPGFMLSFAAVAALLYGFSHRIQPKRSLIEPLFKAQWLSFIGLSALLLFHFQETSLLMPLANLLTIPVLSFFALPLIMLALICVLVFGAVPQYLLGVLDFTLTNMWSYLQWIDLQGRDASVLQHAISVTSLSLLFGAVLIVLAPAAVRTRALFAVPILSLPLFYGTVSAKPAQGSYATEQACETAKLTVLDVGQGLAVVFSSKGRSLLYDTGARFSKDFNSGSAVVAPFLRHEGIYTVDTLVVSHSDNDHAGGVRGLLDSISVANTVASYKIRPNAEANCKAGMEWHWGPIRFSVLSPATLDADALKAGNDRSCVLRIDTPAASVLLTGDISKEVETELRLSGQPLRADVLLMPHHGSKSSSGANFIAAVAPRFAIASAGYKNRFNHPNVSVVLRYTEAGVTQFNTADSGAISFDIPMCEHQTLSKPEAYRAKSNRFWLRW